LFKTREENQEFQSKDFTLLIHNIPLDQNEQQIQKHFQTLNITKEIIKVKAVSLVYNM